MKLSATTSWYRTVPSGLTFAARVRAGWIHPFGVQSGERPLDRVPREARFRAGGATTVRGYPEDSLGPQEIADAGQRDPITDRGLVTIITNLEMRMPLAWRMSFAVFLDGGNVWEEAKALSISNFWPSEEPTIEDYRYSVGGGFRLGTPVGPLRIDYGYGLVRGEPERKVERTGGGEWHFSLGQAF
jgi:outer membrane protein assembly factor BamA